MRAEGKFGKNLEELTHCGKTIIRKLVEDEWKKNLRITRDDFLELLSLVEPFFVKDQTQTRHTEPW